MKKPKMVSVTDVKMIIDETISDFIAAVDDKDLKKTFRNMKKILLGELKDISKAS